MTPSKGFLQSHILSKKSGVIWHVTSSAKEYLNFMICQAAVLTTWVSLSTVSNVGVRINEENKKAFQSKINRPLANRWF